LVLDRDLNAAVNILRRGTVGHTGNTLAESIQAGQTLKQEALTL